MYLYPDLTLIAFSLLSAAFLIVIGCLFPSRARCSSNPSPNNYNATKNKTYHAMLYNAALCEMRNVLENKGHFVQTDLSPQQIIMIILEFSICKVIPGASVAVQHGRRFEDLLPILAALAFKCFMGFAESTLVEEEQFPQGVDRKVSLDVFFFIHNCR